MIGNPPSLILGIETSCDETSVAVVREGREALSNVISSQADLHARFGGVVPEVAARKQIEVINPALQQALKEAQVRLSQVEAVAVTKGPGLVGSLVVGVAAAKAIVLARGLPLIGVHHLEGHLYANLLVRLPSFPAVGLIVSGGHSLLVLWRGHLRYRVLGSSRDDAAGEAFDKGARLLELGYPGGPEIDQLARQGRANAVNFPRAELAGTWDFSFSGVKTALVRYLQETPARKRPPLPDLAASYQEAIVSVLVEKTLRAAQVYRVPRVVLAGGVACNSRLRALFEGRASELGISVSYPPPVLCTDNAAMVASAGYFRLQAGESDDLTLDCYADLPLVEEG